MQSQPYPILGVSALVRKGHLVLLIRRGKAPYRGLWAFPGGRVEAGETMMEAAAREVFEESGIIASIAGQIGQAEMIHRAEDGALVGHFLLTTFAGDHTGGELRAGDDAEDVRWATGDEAAGLDLAPETRKVLRDIGILAPAEG